jgi:hypothetical protein
VSDEDSDSNEDFAVNKDTGANRSPEVPKSLDKAGFTHKQQVQDGASNSCVRELSHSVECSSADGVRKDNHLSTDGQDANQDTSKIGDSSSGDIDDDKEAEDLRQQTLLPKKKRRVSKKLEQRVIDMETEMQLHSLDSHLLEQELQVKGIITEYQRRKKVPDLGQPNSETQV